MKTKKKPDKTIGEMYGPAMQITTEKEADEYFEILVQMGVEEGGLTREKSIAIQRSNLGYFAGYYDSETRERVERLFKCFHPIFGAISQNGQPTAQEALKMGMKMEVKLKS